MKDVLKGKPKIVVIVGPTASGKTSLSVTLAKKFDGEVISADSRQVYTGLDIGSGKVTKAEMEGVPHHLLDVADPTDIYTANDFIKEGRATITDILERKRLPIVAGGTFFYVDLLLGKMSTAEVPPNPKLRARLEKMRTVKLFTLLEEKDPRRAGEIDPQNKVRLIRALEIVEALGSVPEIKSEELYDVCTIGIDIEKETLYRNIRTRLHERIEEGMIEEVKKLHQEGVSYERLESFGLEYRYIAQYLQDKLSKEEMLEKLESEIRKFSKRQMTWLKRDKSIQWFKKGEEEEVCRVVEEFYGVIS